MSLRGAITDVPGIRVGHADDPDALTGCTVVLCDQRAVAGVNQRGLSPATRETDLLRPMHRVQKVDAVLLTGGSAYGLDAASGVMRYMEERDQGFDAVIAKVPIVPAAAIFDLAIGKPDVRPDAEMGYAACQNASNERPREGNAGAGMGAAVGNLFGPVGSTKAGIGSASADLGGGAVVGAIIVVNALGDVVDPKSGEILAGLRPGKVGPVRYGGEEAFAGTMRMMMTRIGKTALQIATRSNTVIGVVATNAQLTKESANIVASMAQNGLSRTIRPTHTTLDGDTLFVLSTGGKRVDVNIIGAYAAEVVSEAIVKAVLSAEAAGGLPAARDIQPDG